MKRRGEEGEKICKFRNEKKFKKWSRACGANWVVEGAHPTLHSVGTAPIALSLSTPNPDQCVREHFSCHIKELSFTIWR